MTHAYGAGMKISVRLSHVIVVAIAASALVFGLGAAGAVAGSKWINGKTIKPHSIPANRLQAVNGKQIAKGTVKGDRIAKRTVTQSALTAATVDDLQQTVVYFDNVVTPADVDGNGNVAVACPASTQITAGYVKPGGTGLVSFANSYVDPDRNALIVQFSIPGTVNVQTICLR